MRLRVLVVIFLILNFFSVLSGKKYYVLDAPSYDPGFFSCFHSVVGFLEFYEKNKGDCAGIQVNFATGRYVDLRVGPNWWNYFFEPIEIGSPIGAEVVHVANKWKVRWALDAILTCNREMASRVIAKYVRVKPHIQKKVKDFVDRHFIKKSVIGVHFRGTDKKILSTSFHMMQLLK